MRLNWCCLLWQTKCRHQCLYHRDGVAFGGSATGVKVGHFSYLGDATIGENVNIGAGTITCNYDGKRKNATTIHEGAFIGSDTMLVAPVTIGVGARTGAGAVVTKDVPDHMLAAGVPARVIRKLEPDD